MGVCECEYHAGWVLMGLGDVIHALGEKAKVAVSKKVGSALDLIKDLELCIKKEMRRTRTSLAEILIAIDKDEWDRASSESLYTLTEVLKEGCL